ncbi:phage major capsid protein [Listeria booriae]|uniref:phage major capsid protein n=1 Tax=Listeria booriae TaxID=1552123 RepID=UPI00164DF7B1|nr:phage major capsid protein [Listeria booriae]MBC6165735.1 phage major capsid protein [Listeria booriae]
MNIRSAFGNFIVGRITESEARNAGLSIKGSKVFVPREIAKEVKGYAESNNLLRKYGQVVRVTGDLSYPVITETLRVDVSSSEREKNAIEISSLGFDAVLLRPVEFDALVSVKKKLLKTSAISIPDLVIQELSKSYTRREIDYMYNGTNDEAINSGSLFNKAKVYSPVEVEPEKIILGLRDMLSSRVANRARWIVNKRALNYVEGLTLPSGKPMLTTIDREDSGVSYNLLGFPLDCTDDAIGANEKKAVFYFGDFHSFVIQEAMDGMEIQCGTEQFALFNEVGFHLYNLLDGKLVYSELEPTIYRLEI